MSNRNHALTVIASAFALFTFPAEGRSQTRDGAVAGGVAGAVIGGIIGHQNHETPEGALIGGAVGAIAGGVFGKQREQQQQIQYYQQQQAYQAYHSHYATPVYTQPVYTTHVHAAPVYTTRPTPVRRPVSVNDVINLTRSGVNENVIINQIHSSGVAYQPNTDDVLTMHDAGVCDYVIDAMQRATIGETVIVSQAPVQQRQVIVHEHYQAAPVYVTRPIQPSVQTYYPSSQSQPTYLQAVPNYRRNF